MGGKEKNGSFCNCYYTVGQNTKYSKKSLFLQTGYQELRKDVETKILACNLTIKTKDKTSLETWVVQVEDRTLTSTNRHQKYIFSTFWKNNK